MIDPTPLHTNPPLWLDEEELNDLPDAFTDKRELWEMHLHATLLHLSALQLPEYYKWSHRAGIAAALRALAVRINGANAIRQDILDIADELEAQ
jgi:hypothetical protein